MYLVLHLSLSRKMETTPCTFAPMGSQTSDQSEAGDICRRSWDISQPEREREREREREQEREHNFQIPSCLVIELPQQP